jgi:hypothetical protein
VTCWSATEASARTIVVRCASSYTARHITAGPAITHAAGHIAFTSAVFDKSRNSLARSARRLVIEATVPT